MRSWSSLRQSSPSIHRLQILLRPFSAVSQCPPPASPPPPPPFISPHCDSNFQKSPNNNYNYNPLLGWVSGIVTGSTLALSLYWLSSTSSFASMKSSLLPAEAAAEEETHPSNPKFLFRGKLFVDFLPLCCSFLLLCFACYCKEMLSLFHSSPSKLLLP